jgi:hypothetical protein
MAKQFGFQTKNYMMEAFYWCYYWTNFAWRFFWGNNHIPIVVDEKSLRLST